MYLLEVLIGSPDCMCPLIGLSDSLTLVIVLQHTIKTRFKILLHIIELILSLVMNTGSEQGKKRKRQDSTQELQNDDIKQAVPKQKKKAKLGGQVLHDSKETDEPSTNESNTKQSAKNTLVTKKDGKSNTSQNSGTKR